MNLKPYADYKESGVEWLGQIPDTWKIDKFRHIFAESSEVNGASPVGEMLSVSGYRGVELKAYDDDNRKRTDDQLENYRVVRAGQLAVNTMWLNYAGLGVSELEGYISPAYRAYWIRSDMERRYVHHLMRSSTYVEGYTALLTGIRPNSLQMSRPNLMSFPVLVPSREEQRVIADYLDQETAAIDAFITDQEKLVALLNERRVATITRAVTMGLSPGGPTKDSGVEWLGEVPKAWHVVPLKRNVSYITSGSRDWASHYSDSGTPFVRIGNLARGHLDIDMTEVQHVDVSDTTEGSRSRLRQNDVLFSITAYLGSVGVVGPKTTGSYISQHIAVVRPTPESLDSRFLGYMVLSDWGQRQLNQQAYGGTKIQLSLQDIRQFMTVVPPVHEQKLIVSFLDRETVEIDAAIEDAREAIALSKERRAAVISAAVTGKINVSNHIDHLKGELVGVA